MKKTFKMPAKQNLKGRSSTISNAFAISITPYIRPSDDELNAYYDLLGIKEGQCAYCLGDGNGRDHLKPLVDAGMPTGYITDIHNLVPCCQKCNSSKGSKSFSEWYKDEKNTERLLKLGLSVSDIEERYEIILKFEQMIPEPLDYESIVGEELWDEYRKRRRHLLEELNENQKFCDRLSTIIMKHITEDN